MVVVLVSFLLFHVFYHISYILAWDVYTYHKKKKICVPKNFFKNCVVMFFIPNLFLIAFFVMYFFFAIPAILLLMSSIVFGNITTRSMWDVYAGMMKKYEDHYFSKYDVSNPIHLYEYSSSSIKKNWEEIPEEKRKAILHFLKPYPYQLIISQNNILNSRAELDTNQIIITKACLTLPIEEIKALLAHEIMHFKVDGKMSDKKRKILFFCSLYFLFFLFYLAAVILRNSSPYCKIFYLLLFCLYLFYFIFFHLVLPERYLYELSELKCDRLACNIKDVKRESMILLLSRMKDKPKKREIWYLKMIRRYILFQAHPNISYRIYKIKHYHNWSIFDYLELPIHLLKQLILGKGWNDE